MFLALWFASAAAVATANEEAPFVPREGQAGKDVVWVPTPYVLVEKMLDMAKVTPDDFVMDLGSGDGRNIIAAAKRGARALGVEYNPDMVKLSRYNAAKAGVADKAVFVEGDMFAADISQATVLALFLLTENLDPLVPKFLALRPGTRIVMNGFTVSGWEPDETARLPRNRTSPDRDCGDWCTAHLYIVPAQVEGTWRIAQGERTLELTLKQSFQLVSGTLSSGGKRLPIKDGRLKGDQISFTAGGIQYTGRVEDSEIKGHGAQAWAATRM
jgi:SAM-dependent methyltransferase